MAATPVTPDKRSFTADIFFITSGSYTISGETITLDSAVDFDMSTLFESCSVKFNNEMVDAFSPRDIYVGKGLGSHTIVSTDWTADFSGYIDLDLLSGQTAIDRALINIPQAVVIKRSLIKAGSSTFITYIGAAVVSSAKVSLEVKTYGKQKLSFASYGNLLSSKA